MIMSTYDEEQPWTGPDIYTDVSYQQIWDGAEERFRRWLVEFTEATGAFPPVDDYHYRLELAAKEVLDALANDDVDVVDHLDIHCLEQDGAYVVDIHAVSSVGDAFLMVYRHDEAGLA